MDKWQIWFHIIGVQRDTANAMKPTEVKRLKGKVKKHQVLKSGMILNWTSAENTSINQSPST